MSIQPLRHQLSCDELLFSQKVFVIVPTFNRRILPDECMESVDGICVFFIFELKSSLANAALSRTLSFKMGSLVPHVAAAGKLRSGGPVVLWQACKAVLPLRPSPVDVVETDFGVRSRIHRGIEYHDMVRLTDLQNSGG